MLPGPDAHSHSHCQLATPLLVKRFIEQIEAASAAGGDDDGSLAGCWTVLAMMVAMVFAALFNQHHLHGMVRAPAASCCCGHRSPAVG